jgi:hypothetical protein
MSAKTVVVATTFRPPPDVEGELPDGPPQPMTSTAPVRTVTITRLSLNAADPVAPDISTIVIRELKVTD